MRAAAACCAARVPPRAHLAQPVEAVGQQLGEVHVCVLAARRCCRRCRAAGPERVRKRRCGARCGVRQRARRAAAAAAAAQHQTAGRAVVCLHGRPLKDVRRPLGPSGGRGTPIPSLWPVLNPAVDSGGKATLSTSFYKWLQGLGARSLLPDHFALLGSD